MKSTFQDAKKHIYRSTAVIFLFQLFGALGAGFIFVVSNILGIEILPAGSATSELLWHIFFWATDFFFIAFTTLLAYYIAGLPALAPALTLSVFFTHFAGLYNGGTLSIPMYSNFFESPANGAGGVNIGFMGYLILALMLGYLIKNLYGLWDKIKKSLGPKLDKPINSLKRKIKALKGLEMTGINLLEAIDLIVLFLILPVASAIVTYFTINYAIALPFNSLGEKLTPIISKIYTNSNALGGLLSGLLVGFDINGPLSMAAFRAAAELAQIGNTVPVTVYGVCFAVVGWVPAIAVIMNKVFKKGGKMDTDDMNLAMTGPINAFFDNMKLTVSCSFTFAMRDPIKVIISYMSATGITGLLAGLFSLGNKLYAESAFVEKFLRGEIYTSFLQPLRSISNTPKGFLLPVCAAVGTLAGAFIMIILKELSHKRQLKNTDKFEPNGDIVLEMRQLAEKINDGASTH